MAFREKKSFLDLVAAEVLAPDAEPKAPATQIERLRTCLLHYIRPIMIDSALKRAEQAHGPFRGPLEPERFGQLVEEMMLGLRMFVKDEQLPQLMVDLAEIVDSEKR